MERKIGLGSRHIFGGYEVVEGDVGNFCIMRLDKNTGRIAGSESFATDDYVMASGIANLLALAFSAGRAQGNIGFAISNIGYAEIESRTRAERLCRLYALDTDGERQNEPVIFRSQEELVAGLQNLLRGSGLDAS